MNRDVPQDDADITSLLVAAAEGDSRKTNELLGLVYGQLKAIAQARMAGENPGHTLQATALVHEAFLKLVQNREIPWRNRRHFYASAAEAMRRILLDHAKARGRQKRGAGRLRAPVNVVDLAADQDSSEILALDEALRRLDELNPDTAQVVRLRFYAGLSIDEVAETLEMSPRTIDRRWKYARAWLYQMLTEPSDENGESSTSSL